MNVNVMSKSQAKRPLVIYCSRLEDNINHHHRHHHNHHHLIFFFFSFSFFCSSSSSSSKHLLDTTWSVTAPRHPFTGRPTDLMPQDKQRRVSQEILLLSILLTWSLQPVLVCLCILSQVVFWLLPLFTLSVYGPTLYSPLYALLSALLLLLFRFQNQSGFFSSTWKHNSWSSQWGAGQNIGINPIYRAATSEPLHRFG